MTQIILTPDQAKAFQAAKAPVQVCDAQGHVLGTLPPGFLLSSSPNKSDVQASGRALVFRTRCTSNVSVLGNRAGKTWDD